MMKKHLFIPKMIMMQMTKFLTKMKVKITMKVTITKVSTKLKKRVEILKCRNLAKKACNSSPELENQSKDIQVVIYSIKKMQKEHARNVTTTTSEKCMFYVSKMLQQQQQIQKMYVLRVKNKICPVIVFCF